MLTTVDEFVALCAYDNLPFEITEKKVEKRGDVTIRDIEFSSRAGNRIEAYLVEPADGDNHPAILWGHWLETGDPTSNRTQFLDEAVQMAAEHGVVSLLPQMPWHGEMDGFFWQHAPATDIQTSAGFVVDFRRCLDLLTGCEDVNPDKLLFVGHDFSGMYGTLMGAIDRRPKAYLLMAVTSHFKNWFRFGSKDKFNEEELAAYGKAIDVLDVALYAAKLSPAPVFLQFGREDFFVPDDDAERMFAALNEPKRMEWYGGQHHLDEAARADRTAWLKEQLARL